MSNACNPEFLIQHIYTQHYENPASLRFQASKTRVAATSSPAARTSASQTNKPRFDGASLDTSSTRFPTGDASKYDEEHDVSATVRFKPGRT